MLSPPVREGRQAVVRGQSEPEEAVSWEAKDVEHEPDRIVIDRIDMREGWVCFMTAEQPSKPDEVPLYLSNAIAAWQKQTPTLTVRAALPIVQNGNTIAVHVWFE